MGLSHGGIPKIGLGQIKQLSTPWLPGTPWEAGLQSPRCCLTRLPLHGLSCFCWSQRFVRGSLEGLQKLSVPPLNTAIASSLPLVPLPHLHTFALHLSRQSAQARWTYLGSPQRGTQVKHPYPASVPSRVTDAYFLTGEGPKKANPPAPPAPRPRPLALPVFAATSYFPPWTCSVC